MKDFEDIYSKFGKIYADRIWGRGSGYGSSRSATRKYRAFLTNFITNNDVESIVELGCGDFQVMKLVVKKGIKYTGYDVVSDVINKNRSKFESSNIQFQLLSDYSALDSGSLLICKDVLQHLPIQECKKIIREVFPQYRHVLVTNCIGHRNSQSVNENIQTGSFTNVDLRQNPYSLEGRVVLEWNAPIRSIIFPTISVANVVMAPIVLAALAKMSVKALINSDYENHPRWRKHTFHYQGVT